MSDVLIFSVSNMEIIKGVIHLGNSAREVH